MTTAEIDFQPPSILHVPAYVSSAGGEAFDLCAEAGLHLDPWQAMVLDVALGERPDGRWAATDVGLNVPRQNGKDAIIEARTIVGLYLLDEALITHSAHQFDTSLEAFRRVLSLIENTPVLSRRLKRVSRSHGEEGFELIGGQRVRFRTRTKGGGRGFSGDCVFLNEAMILSEASLGALLPTLSARRNPQVWYCGSAVDQEIHPDGIVWARVRERAIAGDDDSLAYFEWSFDPRADGDDEPADPGKVTLEQAADPEAWRRANPALDIRVTPEFVEKERRAMDPRTFAVERLGVGDWPDTSIEASSVIDLEAWRALADPRSRIGDPVVFAVDTSPDRGWTSIGAAGVRPDGIPHVEIVDRRRGTGWVEDRVAVLRERWSPAAVVVDGKGQAATLAEAIGAEKLSAEEYVQACAGIFDGVEDAKFRHLGSGDLEAAVRGAAKRPLGDAWAWSRRSSRVDITPLVSVTLALFAASRTPSTAWAASW